MSKSSLRKRLLEDRGDETKEFQLTDYEFRYLKDMQNVLLFHTLRSNLISGFLTYVATTRLGYTSIKENYALQYEVDLAHDDHTLKVSERPKEDVIES